MSRIRPVTIAIVAVLGMIAAACTGGDAPSDTGTGGSQEPVTITVWDYYGEATPVKPAIAGFQKPSTPGSPSTTRPSTGTP